MKIDDFYWEITDVCNLHCKHCYNASACTNNCYIELEKAKEVIGDLLKLGCKNISVSGGEPLLHPNIKEILTYALDQDITLQLVTNGILLSEAFLDRFQNAKLEYQLSIESCRQSEHDFIRGQGSYKALYETLVLFQQKKLIDRVKLHQTLTKMNYKGIDELVCFAKELGCSGISFSELVPIGRGALHNNELSMTETESIDTYKRISEAKKKYGDDNFFVGELGITSKCPLRNTTEGLHPYLSNSGYVYCCSLFSNPEYALGNIYNSSLPTILSSEQQIKEIVERIISKMTSCRKCSLSEICGRGCLAMATIRNSKDDGFCGIRKKNLLKALLDKSTQRTIEARHDIR